MDPQETKHLEFIYNRLIYIHNENPNVDYMLKMKDIIDKYKVFEKTTAFDIFHVES